MSDRSESILSLMHEQGIDYLVALHDGVHSFLDPNPVLLLTGFKSVSECAVLLKNDGTMKLYVVPRWDVTRAMEVLKPNVSVAGFRNFFDACHAINSDTSRSSKVGLVGANKIRRLVSSSFLAIIDKKPVYLDDSFSRISARKTPEEIEKAKKATEIAELGYSKLVELMRPSVTEKELASEIDCYMRSLGADDDFLLLAASIHNRAIHSPTERRIEEGDLVLAEISPSFQGQFTQICRTIAIGKSRTDLHEKYSILAKAFEAGMKNAIPARSIGEIVRKMNEPLENAGYGKYCHPPYMRVRGHGLGLSSIIPGDISEDSNVILEEDMVFVMHPNQYIPETGYMMCGEPVRITKNGANPISDRTPHIDVVSF